MINIPVFKSHLHVEVIPGEGALVLSEEAARALHGSAYEKIVSLIDGQRSRDEIVDALAGQVDAASVYYVLNGMEAKGDLTEASQDILAREPTSSDRPEDARLSQLVHAIERAWMFQIE